MANQTNNPEVLTNPIYTPRIFKNTNWKTNAN